MKWRLGRIIVLIVLVTGIEMRLKPATAADPVIAAAGDIACAPWDPDFNGGIGTADSCRMKATADLLVGLPLAAVLALGDNQYEEGTFDEFFGSYQDSWGQFLSITRPVPGNHEYQFGSAWDYFAYFGDAAGDPATGYYSFNIGAWHLIALNSNCADVGGCVVGSPQEVWLKADLAANPTGCKLAFWHHPRFSSGQNGSSVQYDAFWRDLYAAQADIILVGHDHLYERFTPLTPDGVADPIGGIRQFVVGTGGRSHYVFLTPELNSEVRNADTFGVLVFTLHLHGYEWQFRPEAGKTFTDTGSGTCHK